MAKTAKKKKTSPKRPTKGADEVAAKRAKAYADMEPHLCDCVKMGRIADQLFDDPDRELYDFAVHRLVDMLEELRAGYYATMPRVSHNEAPAPIAQEAQPPAAGRAREAAQTITNKGGAGLLVPRFFHERGRQLRRPYISAITSPVATKAFTPVTAMPR
jgi:hypothetical protein